MDYVSMMAEEKIKQAIKDGELDHLPGKGKKLELEDLSAVPEDMRTSYHMMKNSGYLPEEVKLNKELVTLRELIASCQDKQEQAEYKKQLSEKELHFQIVMEKRKLKGAGAKYRSKIHQKFGF